ncbi:hypothetical protein [Roseibium album]|uniref:hypothetical protein n=1 Tax=Roseibium album TaxID=311410 RepID=UPI00329907E7
MQIGTSRLAAGLFTALAMSLTAGTASHALDGGLGADVVASKMTPKQKNAYFAGVVEGLAYARYIKDGKKTDPGMKCILDWYYESEGTAQKITLALAKFETYPANAVIAAMVAKQCGD